MLSPFVRLSPDDSRSQLENSHSTVKASDPVSQTRSSSTHAGLGLGLAIVQRSLRQHGGTISIHQGSLGGCLVRTQWPIRTTA
ncbi:MAG: ATP-binding protein [Planctomycetota bacterium]